MLRDTQYEDYTKGMHSCSNSVPKKSVYGMPGFGKPLNYIPGTSATASRYGPYFEPVDSSVLFPNALNTFHLDYGLTQ